ncbi:hypothetical protein GOODEAATRI_003018 [Goodea atripinnis]|uniref:Uncharacterized protein n=1 Tax=Goodea atripinnis TaxID=208336 RepID=A0ABV0PUS9_9TELE
MGSRTRYCGVDTVPAPNKYSLPPLLGPHVPNKRASASYTMPRTFSTGGPSVDLAKTPGPCRYNSTDPSVYLPRQPAFSMLGRHNLPKDKTEKPGPGTYNPENVMAHKTRAPAYSMGVRHSEFVTPLAVPPGMLLKPKYDRFRNESVTSSDDLMQSLAMSSKVVATPVVSSSTQSLPLPPLPPLDPSARSSSSVGAAALADSPCLDGEQEATTTFCMLIPKMPQWKFSNSLLSRSPSSSSSSKDSNKTTSSQSSTSSSSNRTSGASQASGPVASLAAVLNSCDPVCVTPCSLQAIRGQRAVATSATSGSPGGHGFGVTAEVMVSPGVSSSSRSGMSRRTRVEGIWPGGEDLHTKGSFIHKPSQGWLHPDKKIAGQGASYIVRHNYYNSIPGKEPPVGGVVDSRLRHSGALLGHIHTQPQNMTAAQVSFMKVGTVFQKMCSQARREQGFYPPGQLCYELHWDTETTCSSGETPCGRK